MSKFSKEFIEYSGTNDEFHFSYLELFKKLKKNQARYQECEGFETVGIKNIDDIPFLVKANGIEINLYKLLAEKPNT